LQQKALLFLTTGVGNTGLKTTLVADVHTDGNEKKVLEEGVGKMDMIVVACPQPDGSAPESKSVRHFCIPFLVTLH
jgi:hypothetical protein